MSGPDKQDPVLVTSGPLRFAENGRSWEVPDLSITPGTWVALSPLGPEQHVDTAMCLAQTLGTMRPPAQGRVELLGHDVYAMDPGARQRLRAFLGYVHGDGGLLSNRTIFQNVALPFSVHRRPTPAEERHHVTGILDEFGLGSVSYSRPHLVSGLLRWRACLARSIVLDPAWLLIEGPKDWSESWPDHARWQSLQARRERYGLSLAICLPRELPGFEGWFVSEGGHVLRCTPSDSKDAS